MKTFVTTLIFLFVAGNAFAQNACGTDTSCACNTNKSAFVFMPNSVSTDLQDGDIVTARYGDMCIGQDVYTDGQALSITVWGENTFSGDAGIPEGALIDYSVYRPSDDEGSDNVEVSYSMGNGTYSTGTWMHMDSFSITAPLPVELASFTAQVNGEYAQLQWATITETNNAGFEVQHQYLQHGDSTWNALGFIQGHGSTTETQNYRFQSQTLPSGRHRFRLKQLDHDGRFQYSDEVELEIELPEDYQLSSAYPNPFNPQTQMTLRLRQGEPVQAQAFDVQGRMVRRLYQGTVPANETVSLQFEAGDLPSGLYLIRVQGASFVETRTVTLVK